MRLLTFILTCLSFSVFAQPVASRIFAHNDYEKPEPFVKAYGLQVGYIEADIFLMEDELLVAHTPQELDKSKTIDVLYLKPLQAAIIKNGNKAYANGETLSLMIDLKTEGIQTLQTLVKKLETYPELKNCQSLRITISGNVPDPATWSEFPSYI
ncbi:MAG: alkaline phosphatase, partial [Cytophagia bacterium]|nr:alkaline phosphatase [Cytophagia bacterium]